MCIIWYGFFFLWNVAGWSSTPYGARTGTWLCHFVYCGCGCGGCCCCCCCCGGGGCCCCCCCCSCRRFCFSLLLVGEQLCLPWPFNFQVCVLGRRCEHFSAVQRRKVHQIYTKRAVAPRKFVIIFLEKCLHPCGSVGDRRLWKKKLRAWRVLNSGLLKVSPFTHTHTRDLVGGFKYFLFSPLPGKISSLTYIFQMGWNHQLEMYCCDLSAQEAVDRSGARWGPSGPCRRLWDWDRSSCAEAGGGQFGEQLDNTKVTERQWVKHWSRAVSPCVSWFIGVIAHHSTQLSVRILFRYLLSA